MKKAQMEIIGLVIVVFIISIALIFVIKYVALKKPMEFKKEFTYATYANNVINTLLQTTSTCLDIDFIDLFDDCGKVGVPGSAFDCDDDGGAMTPDENSCDVLENEIKDIMDKTLKKYNIEYHFTAVVENTGTNVVELGQECPAEKTVRKYPLPTTEKLYIKLEICGE